MLMHDTTASYPPPHANHASQADWSNLKECYYRSLQEASQLGVERCHRAWQAIVTNRRYHRELDRRARRELHAARAPQHWLDDIKQEAVLALWQDLRRELERDATACEFHFIGWLCCVTSRNCRKALWYLQRKNCPSLAEGDLEDHADWRQALEDHLDINLMIGNLPEPQRAVMVLWLDGHAVRDIAQRLRKSPRTVHRILQRSSCRLRRLHCPARPACEFPHFENCTKNSCLELVARRNIHR